MRANRHSKESYAGGPCHLLGRLNALSDGLDEMICMVDPSTHNILFANEAAKNVFGKDLIGKKWSIDMNEQRKMENERRKFEDRLSALNLYAQKLNMAATNEQVYKLTLDAAQECLGFEFANILVIRGKNLHLVAHRGYSEPLSIMLPLNGRRGITVRAVNSNRSVLVPDVRKDNTYVAGGESIRSELAVPVKIGKHVLGVLNIESNAVGGFNHQDRKLLEILASHAAIAISNLKKQEQLIHISKRLEYAMKNAAELMHARNMQQRLKIIAQTIKKFGWRRVVISLRDMNLDGTALVTAGLTREENKLLRERKAPGSVWRERLGPRFTRFKIGEFYYLPWVDRWVREKVHGLPPGSSIDETTTYAGVPSSLSVNDMVDWHPQDMLYAPLRTPEGRIVGILSMDDPLNGRKPDREILAPLELFLHQAAVIIDNVQLLEDLKEAREMLEDKVVERTQELRKSQEQLLRAQRLGVIGELAGMVGHDLRNPLTSIAGATYYLKKQSGSSLTPKMLEMLELIGKNISYSNKIINDLLDYSREIRLDLTEISPKSIVKNALSLIEMPGHVKLKNLVKDEPRFRADYEKLTRAFVNIMKNAVDAMPRGGTLTIKTKSASGTISFVFSDTGSGMSNETLNKIWTPLFTTKAKGMGFGLPICKRIIEAHAGSIEVKSVFRKGTQFTVTIPVEPRTKEEGGEDVWVKPLESSLLTTMKT